MHEKAVQDKPLIISAYLDVMRFHGIISGAPTRTRTADLLITNQLLYQLSYRGTARLITHTWHLVQEAKR